MPSLRGLAAADLVTILADSGWQITLIDPDGLSGVLTGISNDIHLALDPETDQAVSSRNASVFVRKADIVAAGLSGFPKNITDASSKPWRAQITDLNGVVFDFKVVESNPDENFGALFLRLEAYQP